MNDKKITIFTCSLLNNGYLNNPLSLLCINSWERLKEYFVNQGYECEIKIYDYDDSEYLEFRSLYKNILRLDDERISRVSNMFRVYILSKYLNHLYLDLYISELPNCRDLEFDFDNRYFLHNWSIIFNGTKAEDLQLFKDIWNNYLESKYQNMGDKVIFKTLNIEPSERKYANDLNFIHLHHFDRNSYNQDYQRWNFISSINEIDENNLIEPISGKSKLFIVKGDVINYNGQAEVVNFDNNIELCNYLDKQYELVKEKN